MSNVFSIILSSLILVQSVNFSFDDVLQLDELIEHAQFHEQEHGDDFFIFLSKHYGELKAEHSKKHQEEQKDHEQLPFQCQNHISTFTAFVMQLSLIESDDLDLTEGVETNFYYQLSFSSLHKKGLLEPPKRS